MASPGTDQTDMDFQRRLPEIRCQSGLSPVLESGIAEWLFCPRVCPAGYAGAFVVPPKRLTTHGVESGRCPGTTQVIEGDRKFRGAEFRITLRTCE